VIVDDVDEPRRRDHDDRGRRRESACHAIERSIEERVFGDPTDRHCGLRPGVAHLEYPSLGPYAEHGAERANGEWG
jgi:hypothetical protein